MESIFHNHPLSSASTKSSSLSPLHSTALTSLHLSPSAPMSVAGLTNIFSNPTHKFLAPANPSGSSNASYRFDSRVCAKARGFEVNLKDLGASVRSYGQFSAPVMPSSPEKSKEDEDRQNYHVNVGYAIRTLREDFPELFYREPTFDVYRDDIVFKDPMNTFFGLENYKSIFWALRFHGKIFFRAIRVEIMSLSQPTDDTIMVRWTIHGAPRVLWETRVRFDGTSEYKLDRSGKIYEHRVDNIAVNSPPKAVRPSSLDQMIQALTCPSTPRPTCFELQSPSTSILITLMDRNPQNSGTDQDSAWDSHNLAPETAQRS